MEYYLHRLRQGLVIPDGFEEWKDYRDRVTKFILAQKRKDTLVILGAGPSNDIDLGILSQYYEKIYLMDYREEALKEAVLKYHLEDNPNIRLLVSDFWMFPDMALEGLEECLAEKEDITFIRKYLNDMQRWAYENTVYPKIKEDAQVVVLGLHSQFNSGIASLLSYYQGNYSKEEFESLFLLLRTWNEIAVQRFHEYLFSSFSCVYLGYEYAVYENEAEYSTLRKVASLFTQGKGEAAKKISVRRVDGAYETEQDLTRYVWKGKIRIPFMQYDFWNFTKEKGYFMCLYAVEVVKNCMEKTIDK